MAMNRLRFIHISIGLVLYAIVQHVEAFYTCRELTYTERVLQTVTLLTNIVWGTISKVLASVLGIFITIASLIPLPRLTKWCPPMIPLFDGMIALVVGMILYVLILWAWVSWSETDNDEDAPNEENRPGPAVKDTRPPSDRQETRPSCGCDGGPKNSRAGTERAVALHINSEPVLKSTRGDERPKEVTRSQSIEDLPLNEGDDRKGGQSPVRRTFIDIGPVEANSRSPHSVHGSIVSSIRQHQPFLPPTTEQREQQLEISHRDRINIPPADYLTAETQVRPKAKSKSRSSKTIESLEMYTMHIVEISPEEAVVEESEYTESVISEHSLCQHCGADYCDDATCPCGVGDGTSNAQTDDVDQENINENTESKEEESDAEKTMEDESSANVDENGGGALVSEEVYDRSGDVAEWVNRVNPDYDIYGSREESALSRQEGDNANNNNRCNHNNNNNQWEIGDTDSSSETLKGSRRRLSSIDSSEYVTAEEEISNTQRHPRTRQHRRRRDSSSLDKTVDSLATDVLAEGDGVSVTSRRWRRKTRPEVLIQSATTASATRKKLRCRANGYLDSTASSLSGQESAAMMSTTNTTMLSSLRSEIPSTTDGVALISPPPVTLDTPSSDIQLSLAQQLQAAQLPRVILEGCGDCNIGELNNQLSFLEAYQPHLFQKTSVHIFGTANLDTFYEQT